MIIGNMYRQYLCDNGNVAGRILTEAYSEPKAC